MKSATTYFQRSVARHGGYVYDTSADLQQRYGEGAASPDQIWVQPPGTPSVGLAYLAAYKATNDEFYRIAATEAGLALVYGQLQSGGWTNCIDFSPQGTRVAQYRNGQGRGRNTSSLDDDQTQAALRCLMQLDQAHKFQQPIIHESVRIALDALLAAQFANGGFPQVWDKPSDQTFPVISASFPDYDWKTAGRIKNYWEMYTLNDGLAGTVSQVLIDAHQIYGEERFLTALKRLGDFLILAQLPDPQPAWAQQYSRDMIPIWARKFEPPAITGSESQDVLETLLTIAEVTGDKKFLAPVPRAVAYLRTSLLSDGRLARYYELGTNKPLYMERTGDKYSLTHDDSNLPDHYGWKVAARLDAIEARYKRLLNGKQRLIKKTDRQLNLPKRVQMCLRDLDDQGRWLSVSQGERRPGDHKFPVGTQYLSSALFAKNLTLLSEYEQVFADIPR